jgi:hypothetical protein
MDILDWLQKQGYTSTYPGEWIVVSGQAPAEGPGPSAHKIEFHGQQRERAMDTIELVRKTTPEFWVVAIKVPGKEDAESSK